MILTKEDIPFGVGKDNIAYRSAYLDGAKAQLRADYKFIREYGVDRFFEECMREAGQDYGSWQSLLEV